MSPTLPRPVRQKQTFHWKGESRTRPLPTLRPLTREWCKSKPAGECPHGGGKLVLLPVKRNRPLLFGRRADKNKAAAGLEELDLLSSIFRGVSTAGGKCAPVRPRLDGQVK